MISRRLAGPWLAAVSLVALVTLVPNRAGLPDRAPSPDRAESGAPDASPQTIGPQAGNPVATEGRGTLADGSRPPEAAPSETPGAAARTAADAPAVVARRPADEPVRMRLSDLDVVLVRDAVAAYRRSDLAAGDAARARMGDPGAALLAEWMALRTGGIGIDSERVLAFVRRNPGWPGQPSLRRRAEDLMVAERRPAAVLRAFLGSDAPQSAAGKFLLAQAAKTEGRKAEADALVRDAWRGDSFGRELESRILDAFKDTLTTADHRFRMERFLLKENWENARRAADYAGEGYDTLVKARIAVDGRAKNAAKLLEAVPKALKSDTSFLFSQAQLLRRSDKAAEAAQVVAKLPAEPDLLADGDEWWVERRLIARKLLDEGDAAAAYAIVSRHAANSAERRIEAEFHAGWIALRFLKQPEVARVHFAAAAAAAGTPISRARTAYWQGRAADAAGLSDEARSSYAAASHNGITYYGQLAGAKLGGQLVTLRPSSNLGSVEREAASRKPAVRAVAYAYAAGLRELAAPLVAEFGKTGQDVAELEGVSDILAENRDARLLLTLGKLATQRGLPLDESAFPTDGIPAFEPVGNRVERAMVQAIARQESAFDPAALSTAGARGLMQMMPATAKATAKKAGVEFDQARLGDATYNAQLGAAHLGDLMQDWKGSYILTFASYNAGPGNVRKWIQAYGDPREPGIDAVDWVERIPFSETRNYVQRVMENLQVYRKRLDARSALLIESDLKRGGDWSSAAAR